MDLAQDGVQLRFSVFQSLLLLLIYLSASFHSKTSSVPIAIILQWDEN